MDESSSTQIWANFKGCLKCGSCPDRFAFDSVAVPPFLGAKLESNRLGAVAFDLQRFCCCSIQTGSASVRRQSGPARRGRQDAAGQGARAQRRGPPRGGRPAAVARRVDDPHRFQTVPTLVPRFSNEILRLRPTSSVDSFFFDQVLLDFTCFSWVLLGIIGCYWVLPTFT